MPHSISLITTIAAGLGLALIMGFAAASVRLPPLVGYLVAGIIIGPATPGFVADMELTSQLAEDRRDADDVRSGTTLLHSGPARGPRCRHPRRGRPDRGGYSLGRGNGALVGLESRRGIGVRALTLGRLLVVAIPDAAGIRKMVETARALNPKVEFLLRTHSDEEATLLRRGIWERSSWESTSWRMQ